MSLRAIPPLFPELSAGRTPSEPLTGLHFFESARQAFRALATGLQRQHGRVLFVLPAYTCDAVIAALLAVNADLEFIDIDESLDLNMGELSELADVITRNGHTQVVLIPTSLFGAPVRDYKAQFPQVLVVEDRAQSFLSLDSTADFQILSFGMGKQISTFGGGALYSPRLPLSFAGLKPVDKSRFTLSLAQLAITQGLKWLWPIVEFAQSRSPEHGMDKPSDSPVPRSVGGSKAQWMGRSLQGSDLQPRVDMSNRYRNSLPPQLQFNIPANIPYLRYPVRAPIRLTGVSSGSMYQTAVTFAEQHRTRSCPGARQLLSASLLPTHRLVSPAHQNAYLSALLAPQGGVKPKLFSR